VKDLNERGMIGRLRASLSRTRGRLAAVGGLMTGRAGPIEDQLDEVEAVLIQADVGLEATGRVVDCVREASRQGKDVRSALRRELEALLVSGGPLDLPADGPGVVMVVGVNGTGKTTTIAKLAHRLMADGKKVILAAADTFRAAASEQLQCWGDRLAAPVIRQRPGADPSAVAVDAVRAAAARKADAVVIDTAGRLHTRRNLMEELEKMKRVLGREAPGAPHEVILVLDASTGQNALRQAQAFHAALEVTGVVLTKLDGTARGGMAFAVCSEVGLPIRYVGTGEGIEDIELFDERSFVEAILPWTTGA